MRNLPLRRSGALALALLLATAGLAFADTIPADGRSDAIGNQSLVPLGERSAGEVVQRDVSFTLECSGTSHAAAGSTISVQPSAYGFPLDGAILATSTTIAVPSPWPPSGGCPSGLTVPAAGPSTVTMTMPTTPGVGYEFSVMYARLPSGGLSGLTVVTFQVDVVAANTPPTISVPASISAEATSAAGATVTFDVTTGDAEDVPPPAAVCSPVSGSVFPIGTTTVECSVTDSGGLSASGSFDVTVADTTAPVLVGVPSGLSLTTGDPAGAPLVYVLPTATDAVDPNPAVSCDPPPGELAPVGDSSVTCTATDARGNPSTASFRVSVAYVPPPPTATWSAVWGEPVGGTPPGVVANRGRTVPVKVEIFADGVEQEVGRATIRVDACAGATVATLPLAWGSGRWSVNLDTTPFAPGCYEVSATHSGHDAGSFRMDLRGAEAAKASKAKSGGLARLVAAVKVRKR
jgi:hypothetical protein